MTSLCYLAIVTLYKVRPGRHKNFLKKTLDKTKIPWYNKPQKGKIKKKEPKNKTNKTPNPKNNPLNDYDR